MDEIYKRRLLSEETPRRGDLAVIVRDHHKTETGMFARVMNDPHRCEQYCAECGQTIVDYFVEIEPEEQLQKDMKGPFFYPVKWLRRVGL